MAVSIQDLQKQRRWILWRLETVNGKQTKVPYQPNGRRAMAGGIRRNFWTPARNLWVSRAQSRGCTLRGRALYHVCLLVHGFHLVRQSRRDHCALDIGHVCGDRTGRRARVHPCANRGNACGRAVGAVAMAKIKVRHGQ